VTTNDPTKSAQDETNRPGSFNGPNPATSTGSHTSPLPSRESTVPPPAAAATDMSSSAGSPEGGDSSPPNPASELRALDPAMDSIQAAVFQVLRTVYDPEIPVDIFELGLIYGVDVEPEGKVKVTMTLTSPTCPAAQSLPAEVEQKVRGIAAVTDYQFELTWEPTWNPEMMSEAAKLSLGMM
jgi:FeS assembly SUF system protein